MILFHREGLTRLLACGVIFLGLILPAAAADTGPTLHFDYGRGTTTANSLVRFMYFVPLVSPQPVSVFTNAGNTQCARVLSESCRTNGIVFHATCEFEMAGAGVEQNVFDQTQNVRRHESELKAGKVLARQLTSIDVEGGGFGAVEVEGTLTNGQPAVTEVRLRFNGQGHTSPVTIHLEDIGWSNGVVRPENEIVARVNLLTFLRKGGRPVMEVTLASVKARSAANGFWQNFVGGLKGIAANLFLPPLPVAADGHQAMMDFGLALTMEKPVFTFPLATRLKGSPAAEQ